jgi:hypothetical protein
MIAWEWWWMLNLSAQWTSSPSRKWRLEVDDLKKGDIVKWCNPFGQRGTIVKINGREATVLWFDSGERLTYLTHNLIKVEDRGE